ncbi:flagellar export chaperone FlgN [uncultured Jatrophihabitans sp.]|uniref:flagellar export chaperone FlgN n=1 Tax=uncultured Jatrophihabitans sp. TaxID=1610747 RepID=UPI0035C9D4DD
MIRSFRDTIAVVPDPDDAATAFAPVDSLLWSERSLLQRLLYQLSAQELVISAGRTEWLRDSDVEVRALVHDLQLHELARATETDALAARYGLPPAAPLRRIVAAAPEPWATIMADHLHALRELQDAIDHTAERNAALLRELRDREPFRHGPDGPPR